MRLIEGYATVAWRSATTWVTYGLQVVCTTVAVHWMVFMGVLPFLPLWFQLPLALLIAAVTTAPTIIARVTQQPKLNEKLESRNVAEPVQAP